MGILWRHEAPAGGWPNKAGVAGAGVCWRDELKKHLPAFLVFCLSIVLYWVTLPKGVLPGDSGELIAASRTLSIAHPPGYPLYTMVGRLLSSLLAIGSIAYRYNLISALVASMSLAVVYSILVEMGVRRLLAFPVSLALGTLGSFWLQATTAEVYAFNALFTVLLLHTAFAARRYGQRAFLILAFVGGLALSHHLTLIYPLLASLGIMIFGFGLRPRARTLLGSLLILGLGLSVWLYVPVRAGVRPPLMWGRTDTLSGFLSHITAQGYRWRLREFELMGRGADFLDFLRVVAAQAGVALSAVALVGLAASRRKPVVRLGFAALVLLFGFHFAMYNIPDIESHVFPALVGVGLLAGLGLERLAGLVGRWNRRVEHVVVGAAFLILLPNLLSIRPRADQWFAEDYAAAIQHSARHVCGEDCIVISSGHLSTFPLLYAALVEPGGIRVFDIVASDPATIGLQTLTPNIEECVLKASEIYGLSNVALLGPVPKYILGREPKICGMVYTVVEPRVPCRPPEEYVIRGLGEDLREYSSRLLSGSYYLHLARWKGQQGDIEGVDESIRQALAAAGDDEATHVNGAQLYLAYGMFEEALMAAEAAVRINPDFFGSHDLLGGMLAQAKRTDEAIAEYKLALRGNPSPAGVYSNLANAYLSKGDHAKALENFTEAIELDSTLVNAYVGMGLAHEADGEPERALALFRQAISVDAFAEPAYHAEVSLLLRLERAAEAAGVAREGLANLPRSTLLLSDLGLAFLRSDDPDSAIVYLEAAVELDPKRLNARGNLAVALERKGLRDRAIEQYRIYLESAPPGRSRDVALRALERLGAGAP
jgi:tetratricopeptide (TPR) repeat protein